MKHPESSLQTLLLAKHLASDEQLVDRALLGQLHDQAAIKPAAVLDLAVNAGIISVDQANDLRAQFETQVREGAEEALANLSSGDRELLAQVIPMAVTPNDLKEAKDPYATDVEADTDPESTIERARAEGSWPRTQLQTPQLPQPGEVSDPQDRFATQSDRFAVERFHARGGLGEIHIAKDTELNREVALKAIRPQFKDDEPSRARFIMEGEVTGRLEHPGVVPVYGMGVDADGKPFYAMRFIKGQTLTEAVREHHAQTADRRIEQQQLLRRFISICQTMDYAHSRGVLHRDLKPDNIMLGPYGETLVVDWGLAKIISREEAVRSTTAEKTLQPQLNSDPNKTARGSVAGTLLYMSPEQAMGWHDRLRPSADVFSLGAILFELLTGRTLYVSKTVEDAQRKAVECGPVSPRDVNSSVPAALASICLKATSKLADDRYQTAGQLANDIEDFLADEPVTARRENVLERGSRWARKHRTLVSSATAAGLIALAALGGLSLLLSAKNSEIAAKNDEITKQRDSARENLELARKAVRDYLNGLSRDERIREAGLDKLRLQLAQNAQPFYERFLDEDPESEELRYEQAQWLANIGLINYQAGSRTEALKYLNANREILIKLHQGSPANTEYISALAQTHNRIGTLELDNGQWVDATASFNEVLELAPKLPKADDFEQVQRSDGFQLGAFANLDEQDLRLLALTGIGIAQLDRGRFQIAKQNFEQALELAWGGHDPADGELPAGQRPPHPKTLSAMLDLAKAHYHMGDFESATTAYEACSAAIGRVNQQQAEEVDLLVFEAGLHGEFGVFYMDAGLHLAALRQFERAHQIATEAARKYPQNLSARDVVSYAKNNLTVPINTIAPRDQSQEEIQEEQRQRLEESLNEVRQQLEQNPGLLVTRINENVTEKNLAMLQFAQGQNDEAIERLQACRTRLEQICSEHPQGWFARQQLAWTLMNLADVTSVDPARRDEAKAFVNAALEVSQQELDKHGSMVFVILLSNAYSRLAWFVTEPEDGIEIVQQRIALIEALPEATRQAAIFVQTLANSHEMIATAQYGMPNAKSQAAESLQKAIDANHQIVEAHPDEPFYKMRSYMLGLTQSLRSMEEADGDYSLKLQDSVNRNVGYIRNMDPKWVRSDVLEFAVPALEVLAANSYGNEDYQLQIDNLLLALDMLDELYERTANKKHLLKKGNLLISLADARFAGGLEDQYLPTLEEARFTAEEYLSIQPRSQTAKNLIAQTHLEAGEYYSLLEDHPQAYQQYDLAVELDRSENASKARIYRALSSVRQGHYLSAIEDARRIVAQYQLDANGLYDTASIFALAGPVLLSDETAKAEEKATLTSTYQQESIELLRQCFSMADSNCQAYIDYAQQDDDLESIRDLQGFKDLLENFSVRDGANSSDSE